MWHVDASNNSVSCKTAHTNTRKDLCGNTVKFYPNCTINCVHFKNVRKQNEGVLIQTNKAKYNCKTGSKQSLT